MLGVEMWPAQSARQAVNGGVSEACFGTLEPLKGLGAKPKGWASEGPAPHSPSSWASPFLVSKSKLAKSDFEKEVGSLALHELR